MARVLIVEDDTWSRRIVCDVLGRRGHDVLSAVCVADGRAKFALGPAVVLLDIHMPGGGGEVLLDEIRRNPATRDLPVIALTASAMHGDRERFLRLGFTSYFSKPIDVRSFGEMVERVLGEPLVRRRRTGAMQTISP
jgi:two-component system, cell cycle response regulator DivK